MKTLITIILLFCDPSFLLASDLVIFGGHNRAIEFEKGGVIVIDSMSNDHHESYLPGMKNYNILVGQINEFVLGKKIHNVIISWSGEIDERTMLNLKLLFPSRRVLFSVDETIEKLLNAYSFNILSYVHLVQQMNVGSRIKKEFNKEVIQ